MTERLNWTEESQAAKNKGTWEKKINIWWILFCDISIKKTYDAELVSRFVQHCLDNYVSYKTMAGVKITDDS